MTTSDAMQCSNTVYADGYGSISNLQTRVTPKSLKKLYKSSKLRSHGAARGTVTAVAPMLSGYVFSPADLSIANSALGVALPSRLVVNITSAPYPLYTANDPTTVYSASSPTYQGIVGEAGARV